MVAAGNTNLLEGFMWGWRTLSPNGPFKDGAGYDAKDNTKIIILMTDGMNAWNGQSNHNKSVFSPFGYYGQNRLTDLKNTSSTTPPNDATQARDRMDAHTLKACEKRQGRQGRQDPQDRDLHGRLQHDRRSDRPEGPRPPDQVRLRPVQGLRRG
jgi:hypothetical protein